MPEPFYLGIGTLFAVGTQALESSVEKLAMGGGKLRDVMLDVVKSLEQAALKALILGQGPLAGLFGTAPNVGTTGGYSVGGLVGMAGGLFGTGSAGAGGGGAAASAAYRR